MCLVMFYSHVNNDQICKNPMVFARHPVAVMVHGDLIFAVYTGYGLVDCALVVRNGFIVHSTLV